MLKPASALRKDLNTGNSIEAFAALQHRHYAAIAATIAEMTDLTAQSEIAARFAKAFSVNPRFDRARFLKACEGER